MAVTVLLLQPCVVALNSPERLTKPEGYVCDAAGLIPEALKADIDEKSSALAQLTGAQIFVVTVDFLGGKPIRDYAAELFSEWQIGDAVKNNGLLLLLSAGEEDYYLLQGKGLEKDLTNSEIAQLLTQYLEPDFEKGDYESAITKIYAQLLHHLEGLYNIGDAGVLAAVQEADAIRIATEIETEKKKSLLTTGIIALAVVLAVLLITVFAAKMRQKRKRMRARNRRLNNRR